MPRRGRSMGSSRTPSSRGMSTMAAPAPTMSAPPAAAPPRQPGLLAQMATTAAGVAIGSAAGHGLANAASSMFGGGSEGTAQPQQQQQQPIQPAAYDQSTGFQQPARNCDVDAKSFTRCLESTNNDMTACQYYLDALKSCQAFVSSQNI
ncbi:hypothetical protein IW140_003474 [Coemansia sp. RSA 1813]|nr:hypothetical protein EV178_000875 [Coemansia sp. RSA 1646]KAJ1769603.1 hypothetical protein LPJ74_003914 [Coemansia sp. RSA 1843]KAJ2088453.1 hypothetical protein IW138_004231 [Coemansia sp. RSA 986]KAJ2213547.1 hypothetical protein EV179_003772 [Coemansia sp. RSA 487]KAJ2568968.1 hypothetical protein IW140_003474 [Coemansia sp. RSA 1813]